MSIYKQTILEMADILTDHKILECLSKDDTNKKTFRAFNEMVKCYDINEVSIKKELNEDNAFEARQSAFYQSLLHYLGVIDVSSHECADYPAAGALMNCFAEFMLAGALKEWIGDIKNSNCFLDPVKL
jgi:hypothetical protein